MRLLALTFLLFGCSALPSSDISEEYQDEARKIGIKPVYPPREEFQIGDVYLFARRPNNPHHEISTYMGTEHRFVHAADAFMAERIVFQPTPAKTSEGVQADLYGKNLIQRRQKDIGALPIAAFPSVSGDAGFSGGAGIFKLLQAIGIAGGARTQVTLDFNDVRTYWVPKIEAVKATGSDPVGVLAQLYASTPKGYLTKILEQDYERSKLKSAGKDMCDANLEFGVAVVSRVYLTRSISYTYRNGRIISAGIKRGTEGALPSAPTAPAVNVNVGTTGAATADDSQIAALQSQIDSLSNSQGPGDSVSFQTWDARGISFERTYDRPVSIGWDGFEFIDPRITYLICPPPQQ